MQTPSAGLPAVAPISDPTLSASSSTGSGSTSSRLKAACQQFEGEFMSLVLQEMRKTIPKDTLLGDDGHTQEIFTGMMDDQVAQQMAKQGGPNDLAAEMYRQLAGKMMSQTSDSPANTAAMTPAATSAAAPALKMRPSEQRASAGSKPTSQEHIDTNR
jgi:Rod binding domain-containing protein